MKHEIKFIIGISGIDPDCSEHADYLEKITTDFQNQMIASIDESIRERETNKKFTLRPDHEEFMEHAVLVKKKCDGVRGRDHIVKVSKLVSQNVGIVKMSQTGLIKDWHIVKMS